MSTSPRPERPEGFWTEVEAAYRGPTLIKDLLVQFDITPAELKTARENGGWPLRNHAPVNQAKLIRRIFVLVNKQVIHMEKNMAPGDKDIATLNQLVGTVGKLIRFEHAAAPIGKRQRRTKSLAGIRDKLVQRIEELKRG